MHVRCYMQKKNCYGRDARVRYFFSLKVYETRGRTGGDIKTV